MRRVWQPWRVHYLLFSVAEEALRVQPAAHDVPIHGGPAHGQLQWPQVRLPRNWGAVGLLAGEL